MANPSEISVVIPVYNGERYLAAAIESALAQTSIPHEIIVIDDGSTDASAEIARGFGPPVICHRQTRGGAGAARNRGVELAQGNYLAFLDADDLWLPEKTALQLRAIADGQADLVLGYVQQFISPELDEEKRRRISCPVQPMPGYVPGAMFLKRQTFSLVGPFRTDLHVGEFIDWHQRAVEAGLTVLMRPEIVMRRRLHGENLGLINADHRRDYLRVVQDALKRQKAAGTGEMPGGYLR